MKIDFNKNDGALNISLDGRLDTTTAPELEKFLNDNLGDAEALNIDCEKLSYVSSAGLRVLLSAQKKMKSPGLASIAFKMASISSFLKYLVRIE